MDEFSDEDLAGAIRFGLPDDYAVRLLPVILSSFQKTHPKIMIDVTCASSEDAARGHEAAASTTSSSSPRAPTANIGELFRTEPMFWVAAQGGQALHMDPLPIAGGQPCCWKDNAIEALDRDRPRLPRRLHLVATRSASPAPC